MQCVWCAEGVATLWGTGAVVLALQPLAARRQGDIVFKRKYGYAYTRVDRFLLRGGMVRCAAHDRIMTGSSDGRSKTQYRCSRALPTGMHTTHGIPGRVLDETVWQEIVAFLLAPARGLAAAGALAAEAESQLAQVAQQRARNAARRAELDRQAAYVLRCARETGISPTLLEAQLKEVEAEQERWRVEDARLDACEELARGASPQAEELEAICREFADGAVDNTPEGRRAILDALQVVVTMDGRDYTISGILPQMQHRGTLGAHTVRACSCASLLPS